MQKIPSSFAFLDLGLREASSYAFSSLTNFIWKGVRKGERKGGKGKD